MQKLLVILLVLSIINCKKRSEEILLARGSAVKIFQCGTGNFIPTPQQPIYGVEHTVIAFKGDGSAADQSEWNGFYTADGYFTQIGLFYNKRCRCYGMVMHFYQGSIEVFPQVEFLNSVPPIKEGDTLTFRLELLNGKTMYSVNDLPIYNVHWFKTASRLQYTTEITASKLAPFPRTKVLKVIRWKDVNGNWHDADRAFVGNSLWFMEGNTQNNLLETNQLIIGGNGQPLSPGTTLWINN